jgi:hypothetical protein
LRNIEIDYSDNPSKIPLGDPCPYPIASVDDYPVQPMQIPVLFTVEVKDPSNFVFYNQFLQDLESVLE